MAGKEAGEKTEKPTAKRKKDARREGNIARSNDFPAWISLLALTYLAPFTLRTGYEQSLMMFSKITPVLEGGDGAMLAFLGDAMFRMVLIAAPVVLLTMVIGVVGQVAQIGWAPKKMKPDVKRLNPIKGAKNMFGPRMFTEMGKNLAKVGVIVLMSRGTLEEAYTTVFTQDAMTTAGIAAVIAEVAVRFMRNVAMLGLVIAVADYAVSKRRIDKQLKMTKQEMKQEHKQQEGDPHIKGQIRQRQMAMSRNRMMAEVPGADVVLVNPTHIAIAVRYQPGSGAPTVLAKGAGPIAARIREIAEESGIPIVRDVPLARTVFRLVDIGEQIPAELYEAVAKVLAFVYALRRKGQSSGTHESPFAAAHAHLVDLAPEPVRALADA